MTEKENKIVEDLKHHFNKKLVWMFASLHEGEEEGLFMAFMINLSSVLFIREFLIDLASCSSALGSQRTS